MKANSFIKDKYFIEGEEPLIILPKVKISYEKSYKHKKGRIHILQRENYSSWTISYEVKDFSYSPPDIGDGALRWIDLFSEGSMHSIIEAKGNWLIRDYGTDFKVITHPIEEAEIAEKLSGRKIVKQIKNPKAKIEYYEEIKILKVPFWKQEIKIDTIAEDAKYKYIDMKYIRKKDEIRINIENENLEYIRDNKKIIKVFPLNKEIHFYGIKPTIIKLGPMK
ncbi:MAG: hypothetical protein QXF09_06510 [Nitrososphaerota archaeon]